MLTLRRYWLLKRPGKHVKFLKKLQKFLKLWEIPKLRKGDPKSSFSQSHIWIILFSNYKLIYRTKSTLNILYNNINFHLISFMFTALNERKTAHKLLLPNCDFMKQPIGCSSQRRNSQWNAEFTHFSQHVFSYQCYAKLLLHLFFNCIKHRHRVVRFYGKKKIEILWSNAKLFFQLCVDWTGGHTDWN